MKQKRMSFDDDDDEWIMGVPCRPRPTHNKYRCMQSVSWHRESWDQALKLEIMTTLEAKEAIHIHTSMPPTLDKIRPINYLYTSIPNNSSSYSATTTLIYILIHDFKFTRPFVIFVNSFQKENQKLITKFANDFIDKSLTKIIIINPTFFSLFLLLTLNANSPKTKGSFFL